MKSTTPFQYHLEELEHAESPNSKDEPLPELHEGDKALLDVGCGIGQIIIKIDPPEGLLSVGVDVDLKALEYGKRLYSNIKYAQCSAENLPFSDRSFDLVFSRVTLPHTDIPLALAEMHRVLQPNGRIWLTLHSAHKTRSQWFDSIRKFKIKDIIFRLYVLINGLYFHLFGKLVSFPLNGRLESFQTNLSITRALKESGFVDIQVERGEQFLVTAKKRKMHESSLNKIPYPTHPNIGLKPRAKENVKKPQPAKTP